MATKVHLGILRRHEPARARGRGGDDMTLPQVTRDEWFKLVMAAMAFAIAMMFASLLLPPDDDVPQAWMDSYEG